MEFEFAKSKEGFDNHITNSIRHYDDLVNDVLEISDYFVTSDTNVVDIGCSTGRLIGAMLKRFEKFDNILFTGIEPEQNFRDEYYRNIGGAFNAPLFDDSALEFDFVETSFVTSIFTLQFIPRFDRDRLLKKIHDGLLPGGAFVFAEKTIAEDPRVQDIRTFTHYDFKNKFFSYDEILKKEKTLRTMMRPNTRAELVKMCNEAGFSTVDSFWQNHAFVGFIAVK